MMNVWFWPTPSIEPWNLQSGVTRIIMIHVSKIVRDGSNVRFLKMTRYDVGFQGLYVITQ